LILSYGRITAEQCYIIKKTGSDCLCARLEQAGWSMADILALSREQLMEAVVELYLTSEVPAAMASFDAPTADLLSTKELELCEREIALRKMELRERREERVAQEKTKQSMFHESKRHVHASPSPPLSLVTFTSLR